MQEEHQTGNRMQERLTLTLPGWCRKWMKQYATLPASADHTDWMKLTLALCREQTQRGSGGPFAALVVEARLGLISYGLNCVVPGNCSSAHAEVMALSLAQQTLGTHDLSTAPFSCTLYCSAEPCAMCIGAIHWSGVKRIVFAARDSDVRSIGFDEGHKPDNWMEFLRERGIQVVPDLKRAQAKALLEQYAQSGAPVYNAGNHS